MLETPQVRAARAAEHKARRAASERRMAALHVAKRAFDLADEAQAELDAHSNGTRGADYRLADLAATRAWLRRYAQDAYAGRLSIEAVNASDALLELAQRSIDDDDSGGGDFTTELLDGGLTDDDTSADEAASQPVIQVTGHMRGDTTINGHTRINPNAR